MLRYKQLGYKLYIFATTTSSKVFITIYEFTKVSSMFGESTPDLDPAPDAYLGCNFFDHNLGSTPSLNSGPIYVLL